MMTKKTYPVIPINTNGWPLNIEYSIPIIPALNKVSATDNEPFVVLSNSSANINAGMSCIINANLLFCFCFLAVWCGFSRMRVKG